jgi:hypothetical protein
MPDSNFLDAQLAYENLGSIDLDSAIERLDKALSNFNSSSGYTGETGNDYPGNDIKCEGGVSYDELKRRCDADPACLGFNTAQSWGPGGCTKFANKGPNYNSAFNYYKKTENNGGYNVEKQHDYGGNDLGCYWNMSHAELKQRCDNDPNCGGYNVVAGMGPGGCIKNKNIKNGHYYYTAGIDVYIKNIHNESIVQTAFAPIADYYSKLMDITESLRKYINKSAKNIGDSNTRLTSEERYSNRVHPEDAIMAREPLGGFFPELRQSSLPYLISISVFMASLSIFLIFQMNGFSGQINVPPSILAWFVSPAADTTPFYKNPMILGGVAIITIATFVILYIQAKNTNSSRQ